MTQYLGVEVETGRILYGIGRPDPSDFSGAPDARPFPRDGVVFQSWQAQLDFGARPTDTSEYRWVDGAPAWVETATLADAIAAAINRIDSAADAARLDVISRQTNTLEYQLTEPEARSFKAAGYPDGDVPPCVASWVKAKWRDAMTPQQAADDIIATADRWYQIAYAIRELRLCAKEDVRHAATVDDVSARVQQFTTDLATLMMGVS
jgi:hypothetical protein